jgi:hypothetical protein
MKTAQMTLMVLALAAAIPAFAQNTTDSQCGVTNYDRNQNTYTIVNPMPGAMNQQCFVTVVPKSEWLGGPNDLAGSRLIEGNYNVSLSGGGGGGGGGADGGTRRNTTTDGGQGGAGALAFNGSRYLSPGVYRLTIGAGGLGGVHAARGIDGAPSSISNAHTGETVAGYPRAEYFDGTYPQGTASQSGSASSGATGDSGNSGGGRGSRGIGDTGDQGGNGFIRLALADPVQQARVQAAPVAQPAQVIEPTPVVMAEPARALAPAADVRPARRDRN